LKAQDAKFDIQQFSTGGRDYWIKRTGETKDGKELLSYLLSEHGWMASVNGADHVKKDDIVLDCGAHVGVFTDTALQRGASKVVAIEPDPTNLECLCRNFQSEITSGRVIVAPKGVWNRDQIITLYIGAANSGQNSMLLDQNKGKVECPSRRWTILWRSCIFHGSTSSRWTSKAPSAKRCAGRLRHWRASFPS
jgi:hypothetical protein